MHNPLQQDQTLIFSLPFYKIILVLPLSENKLFIVHHDYKFAVIALSNPQSQILAMGTVPQLSSDFKQYSRTKIIFLDKNRLAIFDWVQNQVISHLTLAQSKIYNEFFQYFLGESQIVFWKSSRLLHDYQSVSYDIEVYSRQNLHRIKKYKKNLTETYRCVYMFGQVLMFQTKGFHIHILFLDDDRFLDIQSVYKLLLVDSSITNNILFLAFTHSQLQNQQQISYKIAQNHVEKSYEAVREQGTYELNGKIRFKMPDFLNIPPGQRVKIELKIQFSQKSKYLSLIEQIVEAEGRYSMAKQVINLLTE